METNFRELGNILPRYFRVRCPKQSSDEHLENETSKTKENIFEKAVLVKSLKQIGDWYAVIGRTKLSAAQSFIQGVYPMDISSALPVLVFSEFLKHSIFSENLKVLDLCCCPGSKYQLLSDTIKSSSAVNNANINSLLVGVDISAERLNVCKSILSKWSELEPSKTSENQIKLKKLLFECDGTSFNSSNFGNLVFDSDSWSEELKERNGIFGLENRKYSRIQGNESNESNEHNDSIKDELPTFEKINENEKNEKINLESVEMKKTKRKRMNKSAMGREKRRLKDLEEILRQANNETSSINQLSLKDFDFVFVDAECTHSGSYRHLAFVDDNNTEGIPNETKETFSKPLAGAKYNCPLKQTEVVSLQHKLILNGFQNLKSGGILFYSTCSDRKEENEEVVQWLLSKVGEEASLLPCPSHLIDTSFQPSTLSSNTSSLNTEFISQVADYFSNQNKSGSLMSENDLKLVLSLSLCDLKYLSDRLGDNGVDWLSNLLCVLIGNQQKMPSQESSLGEGALITSRAIAMSGHFLAIIKKS